MNYTLIFKIALFRNDKAVLTKDLERKMLFISMYYTEITKILCTKIGNFNELDCSIRTWAQKEIEAGKK